MLVLNTSSRRLPGVFIAGESFLTPGSCFTDFKGHTTIFKGTIILKIERRLVELLRNIVSMFEKIVLPEEVYYEYE